MSKAVPDAESSTRRTDSASRLIPASPAAIYAALVDPVALVAWLPPEGMSGLIISFDPREGGCYAIELRYAEPDADAAKTTDQTDVSEGRFLVLEPGHRLVQSVTFRSDDPAFAGEMIMTWTLDADPRGTRVTVTAGNVPPGIGKADHDAGLRSSLENLARHLA